jgi:Rps23 Pro-64 3,4-dihydroxylase Tpa1-like proline 4-hydroxylase
MHSKLEFGELMLNYENIEAALKNFKGSQPFDHCIIDGFFEEKIAIKLANEFPDYHSEKWFFYNNQIENKKALNNWNDFPETTYNVFSVLNSAKFVRILEKYLECQLFVDNGLHGGGWHIHGQGGNLNPHLDYSLHPKMHLQRKVNIIIYLSKELNQESMGGHLGLWEQHKEEKQPGHLIKEVLPQFNRAVLFDTTQNSWHGMSRKLNVPNNIFRKSLAVYYLTTPPTNVDPRSRALFAPREEQKEDLAVKELILKRADEKEYEKVYRTK